MHLDRPRVLVHCAQQESPSPSLLPVPSCSAAQRSGASKHSVQQPTIELLPDGSLEQGSTLLALS